MAFNTASAFDIICQLDRNDTLQEVPQNNKQKAATCLDKLHKQDFVRPLACRVSKVLGPISRHRVADILPHMKIVSRASCPGLLVGFLRILCNGLCLRRDFTLSMTTPAVLDTQMSLTLSFIAMNVPGCIPSFFLETCYDIATKKSVT